MTLKQKLKLINQQLLNIGFDNPPLTQTFTYKNYIIIATFKGVAVDCLDKDTMNNRHNVIWYQINCFDSAMSLTNTSLSYNLYCLNNFLGQKIYMETNYHSLIYNQIDNNKLEQINKNYQIININKNNNGIILAFNTQTFNQLQNQNICYSSDKIATNPHYEFDMLDLKCFINIENIIIPISYRLCYSLLKQIPSTTNYRKLILSLRKHPTKLTNNEKQLIQQYINCQLSQLCKPLYIANNGNAIYRKSLFYNNTLKVNHNYIETPFFIKYQYTTPIDIIGMENIKKFIIENNERDKLNKYRIPTKYGFVYIKRTEEEHPFCEIKNTQYTYIPYIYSYYNTHDNLQTIYTKMITEAKKKILALSKFSALNEQEILANNFTYVKG